MAETDSAREKRAWEREAIRLFVDLYNAQDQGPGYRLLFQQERPDAVLEERKLGRKLGVEITHLFYSQDEAMEVMGRRQPPVIRGPETFGQLLEELKLLIRKKVEKRSSYSMAYPIALLIRNASPGFSMTDFLDRRSEVVLPEGVFEHIWYLSRDNGGGWKLLELV